MHRWWSLLPWQLGQNEHGTAVGDPTSVVFPLASLETERKRVKEHTHGWRDHLSGNLGRPCSVNEHVDQPRIPAANVGIRLDLFKPVGSVALGSGLRFSGARPQQTN